MKACTKCGEVKSLDQFSTRPRKDGTRVPVSWCKACKLRSKAAWRAANPEARRAESARRYTLHADKIRESARRYYAEHTDEVKAAATEYRRRNPGKRAEFNRRRDARIRATDIGNVTAETLAAKAAYWGNRCWMCGRKDAISMDHVKPLSKGGAHILANLRPACVPCNIKKHAQWPFPLTPAA